MKARPALSIRVENVAFNSVRAGADFSAQCSTAKRILILLLSTLGMLAPFAHAYQQIPIDVDSRVPITIFLGLPLTHSQPSSGFFPLHVKIANGTRDAHRWSIKITSGAMGRGKPTCFQQQIVVGAGQGKEVDMLVPQAGLMTPGYGYKNVAGQIEGPGITGNGSFNIGWGYGGGCSSAYVAFSETLGVSAWSKIEAEIKTTTSPHVAGPLQISRFAAGGTSTRGLNGSQVKLSELPPDSRALSGIAGLWVSDDDWRGLAQPLRDAIGDWIMAGGNLFVASNDGAPSTLAALPTRLEFEKTQPMGLGTVKLVKLVAGELSAKETVGDILALDNAPLPQWQEDFESRWPLAEYVGVPRLNVPLIIIFVGCFALVIGPLNLQWFASARHRHRLFVTVPLLSVGASILLLVSIALGDGFGGIGARDAIVLFSPGANRISLTQEQISRTRLLFNRSFSFPEDAAISAAFPHSHGQTPGETVRTGTRLSGDWFRSRSTQIQVIRATIPSRAEVRLQPSKDGAPVLLSSAATTMHHVFYIDPESHYWAGEELTPGRPIALHASSRSEFENWMYTSALDFTQNLHAVLDQVANRPGYFYADADAMPEAPLATLSSIQWFRQTILCLGPCTPAAP